MHFMIQELCRSLSIIEKKKYPTLAEKKCKGIILGRDRFLGVSSVD